MDQPVILRQCSVEGKIHMIGASVRPDEIPRVGLKCLFWCLRGFPVDDLGSYSYRLQQYLRRLTDAVAHRNPIFEKSSRLMYRQALFCFVMNVFHNILMDDLQALCLRMFSAQPLHILDLLHHFVCSKCDQIHTGPTSHQPH